MKKITIEKELEIEREVATTELHFEKCQQQYLYEALTEIEEITEDKIVKEIIKITTQRYNLNKIIHNRKLFK
jgi:hypothetical protein